MRICKDTQTSLIQNVPGTNLQFGWFPLSWSSVTSTSSLLISLCHSPAPPPVLSWRFSPPLTVLKAAGLSIVLSLCFWEGKNCRKRQQTSNSFFFQSLVHWFLLLPDGLCENKHTNKPVWTIWALVLVIFSPSRPGLYAAPLHHHRRCGTSWVWWWVLCIRITSPPPTPPTLCVQMNKHDGGDRRGGGRSSEVPLFMGRHRCSISDRGNAACRSLHSKLESFDLW